MNHLSEVLRFRAPSELVDQVERAAKGLGLDRSAFIRMTLTKSLRPKAEETGRAV